MTAILLRGLVGMAFLLVAGCGMIAIPRGQSPAPLNVSDYKPVDFPKWNSGMYADEFVGRWVVVTGFYQAWPGNLNQGGTPSFIVLDKPTNVGVQPLQSSYEPPTPVIVRADLNMRDQIITLKAGQPIKVYGRAVSESSHSTWLGPSHSMAMTIEATRIE